jgi:hypothetical protein
MNCLGGRPLPFVGQRQLEFGRSIADETAGCTVAFNGGAKVVVSFVNRCQQRKHSSSSSRRAYMTHRKTTQSLSQSVLTANSQRFD